MKAVKSPYNVNSLSQKLGALVLGHPQAMKDALETILSSRDALLAGVRALEGEFPGRFDLLPSATNFITLRMPDGRGCTNIWADRASPSGTPAGWCGLPAAHRRKTKPSCGR